jgi:hypothetical protein
MFGLVIFHFFPEKTYVHTFPTLVNDNTEPEVWAVHLHNPLIKVL